MTPARKRALDMAADGLIRAKSALAHEAGCSSGVDRRAGRVRQPRRGCDPGEALSRCPIRTHATTEFSEHQAAAVHALRSAVDGANFSVTLLDGVTGSGKTEVYFEAVARTLEAGQQAVIMLPEIALTIQFMNRFKARFGCQPVEWHSALSPPERGRVWKAAATGEARVRRRRAIGAFSALPGSRPDRRRRGARRRLQAGRPRALSGARHGRRARQPRQVPGRAGVGDAVDREPRQCAHRALSPSSYFRAASRASSCRRSRPSICAQDQPDKGQVAGAAAGRGGDRDARQQASRRCCSSIAAATRR